ncbi:MAG: hypothetical protein AB1673_12605 [Actinomycetota bacterium]
MSPEPVAVPSHWRWREGAPRPAGPAVVFDMDGVLSDATGRQHFLAGPGRKDWNAFFEACGDDPVVEEVARLVELIDPAVTVVLLTGRPVRVRRPTLEWLDRHKLPWDLLVMRPYGDYGASLEFKRRTVTDLRELGFDPRLAIEDDARNQAMFRDEGVPCIYLHSGYYP